MGWVSGGAPYNIAEELQLGRNEGQDKASTGVKNVKCLGLPKS